MGGRKLLHWVGSCGVEDTLGLGEGSSGVRMGKLLGWEEVLWLGAGKLLDWEGSSVVGRRKH